MSDAHEETEGVVIPPTGDVAFAALMDTLVAAEGGETPDGGDGAAAAAPAGDGSPAAPAEGAGAAAGQPAAPAGGDGGSGDVPPGQPGAGAAPDGAAQPGAGEGEPAAPAWAPAPGTPGVGELDSVDLTDNWGELLTGLEKQQTEELTAEAVEDVRKEFNGYIERVNLPARALVGQQVPSITDPDKMEVLRDSQDAADWQDAVKQQLSREIGDRVDRGRDSTRQMMDTLHASVGLFQNNPDIIPGTKGFDKELADKFVAMTKDYELRVNDKLVGYTVPVQPILNQLRSDLAAGRKPAAPAAPQQPTPQQQRAAAQERTPAGQFTAPQDGPQAAITNKAGGQADDADDFSALFGTISPELRTMRI